jgi:hypothetical protein
MSLQISSKLSSVPSSKLGGGGGAIALVPPLQVRLYLKA